MPFDFDAITAPFRMQPGLRRLAQGATQLTVNRVGDASLTEKSRILTHHADTALLAVPGFVAEPAIQALLQHAAREHPEAIRIAPDGCVSATQLGWSVHGSDWYGSGPDWIGACLEAVPPSWRLTALLCLAFAEDFALIEGADGRIPWMAVCLPSSWVPQNKIGQVFTQIHAPVADNHTLLSAAAHLAALVTQEPRWERFVWTITNLASLDNHPLRAPRRPWPAQEQADMQALVDCACWRTERQTFIPVPGLGQSIFTIHVEVQALVQAIDTPARAEVVRVALASMSQPVLDYRGLSPARDRLLQWLAERAASVPERSNASPAP